MSTEVAVRPDVRVAPISKSFDEMMRVADTLLKSGFLPASIKTPAQAVSIILMGREVGLPEMQALRSINVIQGKPTLSAELMLALFSARVNGRAKIVKSDDTECVITFERPGREPHTQRFTIEQAKKLNLAGKDNYFKQPATMLQWRAVSAGLRFYAPDAIAGISYTPDELGAAVNYETGEVIDLSLAKEEPPEDVPAVDVRQDVEEEIVDLGALAADPPTPARIRHFLETPDSELPKPHITAENRDFCDKMALAKKMLDKLKHLDDYYAVLGSHGYSHSWEVPNMDGKGDLRKTILDELRVIVRKIQQEKRP